MLRRQSGGARANVTARDQRVMIATVHGRRNCEAAVPAALRDAGDTPATQHKSVDHLINNPGQRQRGGPGLIVSRIGKAAFPRDLLR